MFGLPVKGQGEAPVLAEERAPYEVGVLRLAVDREVVALAGEIGRNEVEVMHGACVVVAVGDGRTAGGELVVLVVEDALQVGDSSRAPPARGVGGRAG